MIDIKLLTEDFENTKKALLRRKSEDELQLEKILELHTQKLEAQKAFEEKRALQNKANDEMSQLDKGSEEFKNKVLQLKELSIEVKELETSSQKVNEEFVEMMSKLPNLPSSDTPDGLEEEDNVVTKTVGEPTKFDFEPRNHWEFGVENGWLDFDRAAKVSGARFVYLMGGIARMQFAMINWVFQILSDKEFVAQLINDNDLDLEPKAFIEIIPPVITRIETMQRMARFNPNDQTYELKLDDMALVASAEHTLGPMYMDETLDQSQLPIRYVGYSTAFRREAGSYGRDIKGIFRQHQFDKIEMEIFSTKENGFEEQKLMIAVQEYIVKNLGLPYQVMAVCTGDMGTPDHKQVDINTWMPGQGKYRETHTSDYMGDFQARRVNTRYKDKEGKTHFIHMNDATAIAIGRLMQAIMENYQNEDGSVNVPEVLIPFMGGTKVIKAVEK